MFNAMVDEAYELLENNDTIQNLVLPKIDTEISITRMYWKNIMDYLNIINRSPDHFIIFLKNELCNKEINWYSGNKEDGIIIHGKRQKNSDILELIKKYINIYVICSSCKKLNSELNKITNKKYEFKCLDCEMTKTVIL
jgi:translation initiation factor 2 beta subunit (eIF-2beta)/eIF-5